MDDKLREDITNLLAGRHHLGIESASVDATGILALIKQAGYKSPEEVATLSAIAKHAGYVQLADEATKTWFTVD